jgi:CRP-like cAMP-binding protein
MAYLDSLKHFVETICVQSSLGGKVIRPGSGVTLALPGDVQVREIVRGAGTVLVTQGDRLQEVLIVREGTVLVTCFNSEGDEVWSSVRGPDTLVGAELLRRGRCEVDVIALTEVRLLRIGAEDFRSWVGSSHSPASAIIDLLLQEISAHSRDRAMTTGSAIARIARFLRERQKMESVGRPFDIEQRVLARVLQIRPETLSRTLGKLRNDGILGPGPRLSVIDAHRLWRLADTNEEMLVGRRKAAPDEDDKESAA